MVLGLAVLALAVRLPEYYLEISITGVGYIAIYEGPISLNQTLGWNYSGCGFSDFYCASYGALPVGEYYFKRALVLLNYSRLPTASELEGSLVVDINFYVVFGAGPLVNWSRVFYRGYDFWKHARVYWWKEPYAVRDMHRIRVWYLLATEDIVYWQSGVKQVIKNGTKRLCIWVDRIETENVKGAWRSLLSNCSENATLPYNITVVARGRNYYLYVDRELVYKGEGPDEAWLYTGQLASEAKIRSYIGGGIWRSGEPIKVWMFIGNDTLRLPEYVKPNDWGILAARVAAGSDGSVVVMPGPWRRDPNSDGPLGVRPFLLNFSGVVEVSVGGQRLMFLNGTLLTPGRSCTAAGRVYRLRGDAFVALGGGSVDCREWRVVVEVPDGSEEVFYVPNGTAFEYAPPPLDLGNGTRLIDAAPIRLVVTGPVRARAQYGGREYLLRFNTPLGAEERWTRAGEVVKYSRVVYVDNDTRLVLGPVSVAVDGPKTVNVPWRREHRVVVVSHNGTTERWMQEGGMLAIPPHVLVYNNGTRVEVRGLNATVLQPAVVRLNYTVYYWVSLTTPFNKTEGWARRGTYINVTLPQFVDLGNRTALRGPNGTCTFIVDRPRRCAVAYRERLYWVSVRTPFNETEGWVVEGSVVRLPEVFDMGNGTRWVGPGFYAVVNRPVNATLAYKRQYYVELSGVVEWRVWKDEGSSIRLNETVIGGVKYVPQTPFIEVRGPTSARPKYTAYYYAQFSDALGLPNPWASVELCGRRFAADEAGRVYAVVETDMRCEVRAEAPPLGPYSLATIGVVAAVTAAVVARRLKKR